MPATTTRTKSATRTERTSSPKPAAAKRRRATARAPRQQGVVVAPEERVAMIAEAAYYRAEARGFAPGGELEDWLAAEREVDGRLAESQGLLDRIGAR